MLLEQPIDGGDDITVNIGGKNLFQLILTRFLGGPIGGTCCVANARNASAIKCGCVAIIFFQPTVSITSVAWLLNLNKKKKEFINNL